MNASWIILTVVLQLWPSALCQQQLALFRALHKRILILQEICMLHFWQINYLHEYYVNHLIFRANASKLLPTIFYINNKINQICFEIQLTKVISRFSGGWVVIPYTNYILCYVIRSMSSTVIRLLVVKVEKHGFFRRKLPIAPHL